MIDTHAHLFLKDFSEDLPAVIERARAAGVTKILMPNVDDSTVEALHRTENEYDGYCSAMMGIHPTSIKEDYIRRLNRVVAWLQKRTYRAIGEIGIDLHWDRTFLKEQITAFEEQLTWAKALNLPVVIHVRDSFPYVMESIYKVGPETLKGVFHSFGGSVDEAREIMNLQTFKMGINGIVTFKNSSLGNTLSSVPPEFPVLETDAPYLSPVPYRGKRNEPAYMAGTLQKLADIYRLSEREMDEITTNNAKSLFGFDDE